MRTRLLLAALPAVALAAWLVRPAAPAPEAPDSADSADSADTAAEEEWSRSEQERFMCQIGYVQC